MMAMFSRVTMILSATLLAVALPTNAQTSDPMVGTWRLNVAKSKYDPGPTPKSITTTYEAVGKGYRVSVINIGAGGKLEYGFTSNLDGKDVRVTGNNPNADLMAIRRVDARTIEMISKKGGKVTVTQRNVISTDGKTRTVTTTGIDAFGQKVNNVAVFEKQ
jgi:hypothetical protein